MVAMATYSSHRLIMGKEEIDHFFSFSLWIFVFCLQKCLFSSPLSFIRLLSISVNLIVCRAAKRVDFLKMFKNLLLRNHKGDEPETWHTCLGHWLVYKLCF